MRWISILAVALSLWGQACLAAAQQVPRKKILPYLEAEGTPADKTTVAWLSASRVAFTAVKPSVQWQEGEKKELNVLHRIQAHVQEVRIFDVETRKTMRHADGRLNSYEDGVVTIVLEEFLPAAYYQRGDATGAYDVRLVGPLGKEQKVRHSREDDFKPKPAACPEKAQLPGPAITRQLKREHGCLVHLERDSPQSLWIYYRADGQKADVPLRPADLNSPVWIDWLGAYLLGDFVTMSRGRMGATSQVVALMKPDGRVMTVDLSSWSLTNVRPTRAGMTAVQFMPSLDRGYDGIYLWHASGQYQIAEGYMVSDERVQVSPDGCRLAYVWEWRHERNAKRLRVLDVCVGLGLRSEENPFEW